MPCSSMLFQEVRSKVPDLASEQVGRHRPDHVGHAWSASNYAAMECLRCDEAEQHKYDLEPFGVTDQVQMTLFTRKLRN